MCAAPKPAESHCIKSQGLVQNRIPNVRTCLLLLALIGRSLRSLRLLLLVLVLGLFFPAVAAPFRCLALHFLPLLFEAASKSFSLSASSPILCLLLGLLFTLDSKLGSASELEALWALHSRRLGDVGLCFLKCGAALLLSLDDMTHRHSSSGSSSVSAMATTQVGEGANVRDTAKGDTIH